MNKFILYSIKFLGIVITFSYITYLFFVISNEIFKNVHVGSNCFLNIYDIIIKKNAHIFNDILLDKTSVFKIFIVNVLGTLGWIICAYISKLSFYKSTHEQCIENFLFFKYFCYFCALLLGVKNGWNILQMYRLTGDIPFVKNFLIFMSIVGLQAFLEFFVIIVSTYVLFYETYLKLYTKKISKHKILIHIDHAICKYSMLLPLFVSLLLLAAYLEVKTGKYYLYFR